MADINYNIVYSRRRSISIVVSPDKGVTVRAPFKTSVKAIDKYVKEKSSWIEKHLNRYSELTRINSRQYMDGEKLLFLGNETTLRIIENSHPFIRLSDNYLETGINNAENRSAIRMLVTRWYTERALEVLRERLRFILESYPQYGFRPQGITIRTLRSRWGSCSSKGKITLNSHLVKLNPRYIDYVIIHELCHLKHHNHGKEFHRLLGEIVPDYKTTRKNLREFLMN